MYKIRKINIEKAELYKDIERATYKRGETILTNKVKDETQADTDMTLDKALLDRFLRLRDAKVRTKLMAKLTPKPYVQHIPVLEWNHKRYEGNPNVPSYITSPAEGNDDFLVYSLYFTCEWDDNRLAPMGEYIYAYLLKGCIWDWYNELGQEPPRGLADELNTCLDMIASLVKGKSYAQRPLNPFGTSDPFLP